MKLDDVTDILLELVAHGGGNEALDPLYDLIADHPGSPVSPPSRGGTPSWWPWRASCRCWPKGDCQRNGGVVLGKL
jgi:hypothetical protein